MDDSFFWGLAAGTSVKPTFSRFAPEPPDPAAHCVTEGI
jgi:hypothetical protein